MTRSPSKVIYGVAAALGVAVAFCSDARAWASDHFDSPLMTANPQADVADVYAWTAPEGRRLNLVMTVVGHSLSDRLSYTFHIDSGPTFGRTNASTTIVCRFPAPNMADCRLGTVDQARGDVSNPQGLEGRHHRFRVFEGRRDDPFYNNVKGSLGAYGAAATAVKAGALVDAGGCPHLDETAAASVAYQWRHTDGGPAQNLLANWTASAIVIQIDLAVVAKGGPILAIWGATASGEGQLDRMGRPFVGNTLLGASPFSDDVPSGDQRQRFNTLAAKDSAPYVARIGKSLAFQDGLDGACGNQLLADRTSDPATRYMALARVFADDRLWVNSASRVCTQFFAVELAAVAGRREFAADCGGRTPVYDTPNVWRSLLIAGASGGKHWDGLEHDEHAPSATTFPFLAAPDPHGVDH
jgi:hypothetical protein